jgi:hypothetical protein
VVNPANHPTMCAITSLMLVPYCRLDLRQPPSRRAQPMEPIHIAFLLFPNVTQLDLTGSAQV